MVIFLYYSIIYNSYDRELVYMYINRWIDEESNDFGEYCVK